MDANQDGFGPRDGYRILLYGIDPRVIIEEHARHCTVRAGFRCEHGAVSTASRCILSSSAALNRALMVTTRHTGVNACISLPSDSDND